MLKYEFIHSNHEKPTDSLFDKLPPFIGDVYHSRHNMGNGEWQRIHWCCDEKIFDANRDQLIANGFSVWQENTIGANRFVTLENGELEVHLSRFSHLDQVRITVEPLSTLPIRPEDNKYTDRGFKPTVTQLFTDFSDVDCGMSYCCQLCDGSFAVIDGGMSHHGEADQLYNHMISKLPEGEKPVIAFWVLTHHHPDHVNCFKDFASRYLDKVDVEAIVYNNPCYEKSLRTGEYLIKEYTLIEEAVEKFPETTKIYKPHCGEVYHVRNAVFETYYTQDELAGLDMSNTNNTSIVFKMTLGNKKVLWLGDVGATASRFLIPAYKDLLKSDVVQIAHHGYGDAPWALYYYVKAPVALWPVPDYRTTVIEGLSKFLTQYGGVKEIYFAHAGDHTIDC